MVKIFSMRQKKSDIDHFKAALERKIQKTAEVTGNLIDKKIASTTASSKPKHSNLPAQLPKDLYFNEQLRKILGKEFNLKTILKYQKY